MISAFMDAGNSAHRLRSKKSQYGKDPAKPVTATLIVSAEQGIAVSAKEANTPIYNGIFSRLYEIYPGEFGMFDDLCGFSDGASLGKSCKTLRNVWYMSACNGILTGHEAKQP